MTTRRLHVTHFLVICAFIAPLFAEFDVSKLGGILFIFLWSLVDASHDAGTWSDFLVIAKFHAVLALSETLLKGTAHVALLPEMVC